jgi:hypothetical protein
LNCCATLIGFSWPFCCCCCCWSGTR